MSTAGNGVNARTNLTEVSRSGNGGVARINPDIEVMTSTKTPIVLTTANANAEIMTSPKTPIVLTTANATEGIKNEFQFVSFYISLLLQH